MSDTSRILTQTISYFYIPLLFPIIYLLNLLCVKTDVSVETDQSVSCHRKNETSETDI